MTAVIFDLDGTLVHTAPSLHGIVNRVLAEAHLSPLALELTTSFIGHGIEPMVERCFRAAGRPLFGEALADVVGRFGTIYAERPLENASLFEGVLPALASLAGAREAIAVCTNKPEKLARAIIEGFGLAPLVKVLIGGDTLPVKKPNADVLLECARRLSVEPDSIIMVGDSEVDSATAQAASVPFFLFSGGYRTTREPLIGQTAAFDDFCKLPTLVRDHRLRAKRTSLSQTEPQSARII